MIRPYITRKNLIAIAIASLYACLYVFVGLCLTANEDTVIAETNLFLGLAKAMGMQQVALSGATSGPFRCKRGDIARFNCGLYCGNCRRSYLCKTIPSY